MKTFILSFVLAAAGLAAADLAPASPPPNRLAVARIGPLTHTPSPQPPVARAPSRTDDVPPARRDVLEGGSKGSRSLVVFLHGGSWSPRSREELARRALNDVSSEARKVGVRVLVPLLPAEAPSWSHGGGELWSTVPWASPAGEERVLSLVEHEVAAGEVDETRVSLAGHGAGATAALLLAARHPERFAALALWSGSPMPLWDADRQVVGLAENPVQRLSRVAVYLFTADDDPVLDRAALALFTDAMLAAERAGEGHVLRWDRGEGGHGFGERGPARGLRFLKEQRKAVRP